MPYPQDRPRRGEVYWVDFDPARGSEQAGRRPAVVISLDSFNRRMSVVVIIPLTTRIRDPQSIVAPVVQPTGAMSAESAVLCFQPLTVSHDRLDGHITTLAPDDLVRVDRGLLLSFGLKHDSAPSA